MVEEVRTSRVSTKDIAYKELREKIIKCILEPGQPIVEDELAKELQISRTPLREALQILELEGLVSRGINGRMNVAPISIEEVKEIFIIRSNLEGIVIENAIDHITQKEIDHLTNLVEILKMTTSLEDYERIDDFGSQFHEYIYTVSRNKVAVKFLSQLNSLINRYRRLAHQCIIETKKSVDEHEMILNYIIKKDKVNAVAEVKEHILGSMNQAIKTVEKYKGSQPGQVISKNQNLT
ncbi:GntR family transcriptional regulator [Sporosarcina sp. JAI121]|uniref:GntR family transcriptional regulator n=1 Tax=Sporosarcina sp. JAI121 TaxID=2723064 RepID=UPI0015C7B308|nr:GntR family transcriptional regulator [Sporosarcina sp. JAI121]NYF23651.1 DNA-binding GntR family transcriptional regulator [Sporosarcina sp. JAI121]